jgi:NAD(P)-dependent dehydrogenase (short-subunit alcohol dehydrogenase family)
MTSLSGQQVLIVGGSSGIGLGIARVAAQAGAVVTIAARNEDKLKKAAAEIGHGATGRRLDQTDDASVSAFFGDGKVWDHVVTSAGAGGRGFLPDISMADAQAAMNSKFWGYFRVARAAKISKSGSLTFISGKLGKKPSAGTALIAAVNSAIEGLARGLRFDLAPTRVNTVSPGVIDTPMWDRMGEGPKRAMFAEAAKNLPAGRIGQPDDVGTAVLFLMTNPFATGALIDLDGGAD